MKMASKIAALLLVLAMVVGLAACSGNGGGASPTETTAADLSGEETQSGAGDATDASGEAVTTTASASNQEKPGTTAQQASTAKVNTTLVSLPAAKMPSYKFLSKVKGFNLKIVDPWTGAAAGTVGWTAANNVKKAVESKYGCTVTQVGVTSDYNGQVVARQTANNPLGHVLKVQNINFVQWLDKGYFSDLNYGKTESLVDITDTTTNPWYHSVTTNFFKIDNKLVAFRHGSTNDAPLIYYDKNKVKSFGEDPLVLYNKGQWTMDKLKEYAKKAKNGNQIGFAACDYPTAGTAFVHTTGGSLVKLKTGAAPSPNLTDAKTKAGLQVMYEWFQTEKIISVPDGSWDQPYKDFWNGKVSMILSAQYVATKHGGTFKGSLGVVPFPKGSNSKPNLYVDSQFSTFIPAQYQKQVPVIMFIHNAKDRESWAYSQTDSIDGMRNMGFKKGSNEYNFYYNVVYGKNGQTCTFTPLVMSDANNASQYSWTFVLRMIGTQSTVQSALDAYGNGVKANYESNWKGHKLTGKW